MQAPARHIWLVRHGARLDVHDPSWLDTAERPHDTPLSPDGLVQAGEVGRALARERIDHLFASPFLRALETADRVADAIGLPIRIEHGLCESYLAKWFPVLPTFMPRDEVARRFPRVDMDYQSQVMPQYPEDPDAARNRMARTIRGLTERFTGNLLLISHGGAISGLCAALVPGGAGVHAACCCLIQLTHADGQWTLTRDGRDTSHLGKTESVLRFA